MTSSSCSYIARYLENYTGHVISGSTTASSSKGVDLHVRSKSVSAGKNTVVGRSLSEVDQSVVCAWSIIKKMLRENILIIQIFGQIQDFEREGPAYLLPKL